MSHLRSTAIERGRQLHSKCGIQFNVFGVDQIGRQFDYSKFYLEMMDVDDPDYEPQNFKSYKSSLDLESEIRKRRYPKRAWARLTLSLAEGVDIGVRAYVGDIYIDAYYW